MTAAGDPGQALDFLNMVTNLSPVALFALLVFALMRRWFVLPREVDERDKQIAKLQEERDKYEALLFKAVDLTERVATVAESREKRR